MRPSFTRGHRGSGGKGGGHCRSCWPTGERQPGADVEWRSSKIRSSTSHDFCENSVLGKRSETRMHLSSSNGTSPGLESEMIPEDAIRTSLLSSNRGPEPQRFQLDRGRPVDPQSLICRNERIQDSKEEGRSPSRQAASWLACPVANTSCCQAHPTRTALRQTHLCRPTGSTDCYSDDGVGYL